MSEPLTQQGEVFTCQRCGGEFVAARSSADCDKEMEQEFGVPADLPKWVVCDPCYQEFMKWYRANCRAQ